MGVLNLTPDSFSDGGSRCVDTPEALASAVADAVAMVEAGADILDIGGESTRPGAKAVSAEEECARVLPLIEALQGAVQVPLSIDTCKASVARQAVGAGAEIVNDISGGRFDASMVELVTELGVVFVCGQVRGRNIDEVHSGPALSFDEVLADLRDSVSALPLRLRERTIVDPCIGFGKTLQANLALVQRAGEISTALACPVLVGPSRKRFLLEVMGAKDGTCPMSERDAATVGACLASVSGGAHLLRVHDVAMTDAALKVFCAARELAA